MEQNQLAWVTYSSEATLLGQLCFKNILSQNLLFPQMPTLSTLVSVSWVPAPWVRARTPSAFEGLANCPDNSFFLPNLSGYLPKSLLNWRRWYCQQKITHRPKTCHEWGGQSDTDSPMHEFLSPFISLSLTSWSCTHPWETIEGLDFFHCLSFFFFFFGSQEVKP